VLSENETILPVAYDGEFYLPLGVGVAKGNQTEITIDRLPEPVSSGERSLGGSIRIFFQKVLTQKLSQVTNQIINIEFPYPLLSAVTIPGDRDIAPDDYDANPANVQVKVADAQKIVVFIHGIIGDTYSMTPCVQHAKVKMDGQIKSIAQMYDLVLGFDYENLNTSIEDNARLLKQRLEAVGLTAGHGKTLHIVAHSMGGLVSRWFIEREGGNQMVSHLIMLGTPNGGSPWPNVQEMVTPLLAIGLNSLAAIALPMPAIAALLKLAGTAAKKIEDIDISLDQMKADSEFQKALATSPDPGIPYTILAGNTSLRPEALPAPGQTTSPIQRLMGKVFDRVVELPFLPDQPNDIAVTVKSIENVSQARSPQPIKTPVACNHLVYFIHQDGLDALALAVTNAFNTASSASTTSTVSTIPTSSTVPTVSPVPAVPQPPTPSPSASSTPIPTAPAPTADAGLPVATRIEPDVPPPVATAASTPATTSPTAAGSKSNFWLGFILGLLAGVILTSIFLFMQQRSNSPEPNTPSSLLYLESHSS
jgi:pimeloyl-ACP methyl ester carboxylesterase